jgi:hypothetical protein
MSDFPELLILAKQLKKGYPYFTNLFYIASILPNVNILHIL